MTMIQGGLKEANAEKNDFEVLRSQLSNIVLGDTATTTEKTEEEKKDVPSEPVPQASTLPEPSSLPEPPIVVHVKGTDKQNP